MSAESTSPKGEIAKTDMGWQGIEHLFTYRKLSEPHLSTELARLALAKSQGSVDSVTFQPCLAEEERSQDRFVVHEWDLMGGEWTFSAVFDGHAGHDTVDHTVAHLPSIIKASLSSALQENTTDSPLPAATVSGILSSAISSWDDDMAKAVLDLFPGGTATLAKLDDDDIRAVINDAERGGENAAKVSRCMRGSTVLVALVDPPHENLWVASLGDCIAVLGTSPDAASGEAGKQALAEVLSVHHNGENPQEVERIKSEHPGEDECVLRDRVLGAIAVTRAVGDHLFKFPTVYTKRVFMNAAEGFRMHTRLDDFLGRNLTPPYLSNTADVRHVALSKSGGPNGQRFLILCSDGLADLYRERMSPAEAADDWVRVVGEATKGSGAEGKEGVNAALALLRAALGGDNIEEVSRMITVELEHRWMDDTTILVQRL